MCLLVEFTNSVDHFPDDGDGETGFGQQPISHVTDANWENPHGQVGECGQKAVLSIKTLEHITSKIQTNSLTSLIEKCNTCFM